MFAKFVLAVPAAAVTVLTLAAGAVATSDGAEARTCRRVGFYPNQRIVCETMSTPKPDKPNQKPK